MTPRLRRLLERACAREGTFWQRRGWAAAAFAETEGQPAVLRQARILERILQEAPAVIGPEELLVGTQPCAPIPADAPVGPAMLPDIDALRSEEQRRAMRAGVFTSSIKTGHLTPDYARLLAVGLEGMLGRVQARRENGDSEHAAVWEAMQITLRAASGFFSRHADVADTQGAACDDPARREELTAIACACRQVAFAAPRTLHEALQLLWFTYLIQCLENGESTGAFALGRFDQYMYPFWEADLAAGKSREELLELVGCFWVKLNEFTGLQVLNLTIAGSDADGRDCVNDLSYACLELMAQMRTPVPSLSVRWHEDLEPAFFRRAVEMSAMGFGQPAFYGDPAAMGAMEAAGVASADAADVVPGGCVELGIQGCCNPWVGNFFNLPKCLELALHDGIDPLSGEQVGPVTGHPEDLDSFEKVLASYKRQVESAMALMADSENLCDRLAGEYLPYPFLSSLVGDCIERGLDITQGGARYNFTEDHGIGIAHVVDSLLNVRRLVFGSRELTLPELVSHLDDDFATDEALRRRLQRMQPAYGDATEETTALVREVLHHYFATVEQYSNPRGGPHRPGLLVWTLYDIWADRVGALPDGRRRGQALVSSIGPRGEAHVDSPTSIIIDSTSFDHWHCAGALTLNLRFDAASVRSDKGLEALEALLRVYFERGGMQVQLNVVNRDELLAAQAAPEAHVGLLVRVSGFVARFVELCPRMQDEIIARTELEAGG